MRTFALCVVMLVAPSAAVMGWHHYKLSLEQQRSTTPTVAGARRGEVLFFNATWCGPCKKMKPIVAQLRSQGLPLKDIDVDKNASLAQKYKIRGVPTFVFLEDGKEVNRVVGGTSPEKLKMLCAGPAYH